MFWDLIYVLGLLMSSTALWFLYFRVMEALKVYIQKNK